MSLTNSSFFRKIPFMRDKKIIEIKERNDRILEKYDNLVAFCKSKKGIAIILVLLLISCGFIYLFRNNFYFKITIIIVAGIFTFNKYGLKTLNPLSVLRFNLKKSKKD